MQTQIPIVDIQAKGIICLYASVIRVKRVSDTGTDRQNLLLIYLDIKHLVLHCLIYFVVVFFLI